MTINIYRQLQERLDLFSMGFPATDSGIEIEILKYLFTPEDATLALALTHQIETPEIVARRINLTVEKTAEHLDDMAERGLIFRVKKNGTSRYGAIAFVHGIFEFQLKTLKPDLAKMTGQYFKEAFDDSMQKSADYFLRVIPVNQSIEVTRNVAAYDDAVQILKSKDRIIVTDCICRTRTEIMDEGCGKIKEACFMFGSMGQYYLDRDMGREISLDKAIEILEKCREQGLVTQPATSQNPSGMCNCCGDCCGVLKAINQHPHPASIVFSNHMITADKDACTGCEACLERCQMNALGMDEEGLIEVSQKRCIGCGLCVTTCPTQALTLVDKPENELRLPPETTGEQMMHMARKRGLV
jgi:H+/Na+-translocating ferredoxin:NAD+ oxidoreductase subunit B